MAPTGAAAAAVGELPAAKSMPDPWTGCARHFGAMDREAAAGASPVAAAAVVPLGLVCRRPELAYRAREATSSCRSAT